MKYALLIHLGEGIFEGMSPAEREARTEEHRRLQRDAAAAGHYQAAVRLAPVGTAVRVATRGEEQVVTDGPFPETKEHLVGLYVIDAESLEQAIAYARRIPVAPYGTIEIRPIAWEGSRADFEPGA